jgi:hypothetical protein
MAEVPFEYALEVIRALSLEDQERLHQWLAAQKGKHASPSEGDKAPSPDWYTRELRWLSEHQVAYAGQWVTLDVECLFSHGTDAAAASCLRLLLHDIGAQREVSIIVVYNKVYKTDAQEVRLQRMKQLLKQVGMT